jgi:hypothetical protein
MVIPEIFKPYWNQNIRALCEISMASYSLLHMVALGLGKAHAYHHNNFIPYPAEWAGLADILINHTSDIHHVRDGRVAWYMFLYRRPLALLLFTPLTAMINSFTYHMGKPVMLRYIPDLLMSWLSRVQSNGYDLKEYGRRENEMLHDEDLNLCRVCCYSIDYISSTYKFAQIRGYEYGPEPEDWKILWNFPEKSYAADFWRLVEDGPQLVPGAWVEDSDDDEEDF